MSNATYLKTITAQGMQAVIEADNEPIRMLCWKQPFADLMLPPYNKVETRKQLARTYGLILIVATQKPYTSEELIPMMGGDNALLCYSKGMMNPEACGKAIGIGNLIDCRGLHPDDKHYLKWKPGMEYLYAYHFNNVFPIEPFEVKGFQGWRYADAEIRSKINIITT